MAEEIKNPEFKINPNILPENPLKSVEDDIKGKALTWNENRQLESMSASNFYSPFVDNRIKTQDYIIDPREVFTTLSSGEMVSKYPSYIRGIDNEEYHAQRQTAGEKWKNGIIKFGGKTLNAVVGGTVGTVYGIGSWINNGSFESVYNNDFSNWLADLDTKMNHNLANYYTKQEQDKNIFGQMATANFWSDKVLGGLSFTTGAIISEGIWAWATGGASLATAGARWGARSLGMQRVARALSKTKDLIKSPYRNTLKSSGQVSDMVLGGNFGGRLGEAINTTRFTMTSAGYEASVEALQFRREQEENFLYNFQQMNGRMPSENEMAEFKTNLESAANSVFATNMAIVGSSNLVTLGNIFKVKSPFNTGLKESINRRLYGIGKADDALSTINKVNRKALPWIKNAVTEGLYEEGSQSMTTNVADQWLKFTYDDNRIGETFDISGAVYEAMAEQYGTREGWVENGVGMIIGLLGEAGTRNTRAELNKEITTAKQRQAIQKTFASEALSKKFLNASRIASFNAQAEKAEQQGNITEARIAQDGAIISYLTNRYELGDSNTEIIADVEASLETVTQDQLTALGITQELSEWKAQQLEAFTQVAGMFSRTREFAERLIGRGQVQGLDATKLEGLGDINQQELAIQAVTFSLMAGHRADTIMREASRAIGEMFGTDKTIALDVVDELYKAQSTTRGRVALLTNHIKNYRAQQAKLEEQLREASAIAENQTGEESKGDKILELSQNIATLQQKRDAAQQELESIANNLNISKSSLKQAQESLFPIIEDLNIITSEDLLNLDENIDNLQKSVNELKAVNPEVAARAENILTEFANAKRAWKSHRATVDMISSGKIDLPSVNTRLGRILKKGATIDDANKQWLSEILQDYADRVFKNLSDEAQTTQEVTQETVIDKLRKNEDLSKEEREFYNQNKDEIDNIIKQEPLPKTEATQKPLSQLEYLKQRYNEVINNLGEFGQNIVDINSPKPTNSEIEEFKYLYNKQLSEPLTGEEVQRYEQLHQQLGDWRVLGSFIDKGDGMSLADLIELIEQHERQEAIEETKSDFTPQDVENATSNMDESSKKDDHSLGQNVLASVTVKKHATTGKITIHHLNPLSITGSVYSVVRGKKTLNNPANIEVGDIVTNENGITFKVIEGRNIELNSIEDFNALGFIAVNSGTQWSYSDVYENNGSEIVKKPSELTEPNLQPEYAFEIEAGKEVSFEIDRYDSYTKSLLDAYRKSPTEENLKKLQDGIKIYMVVDGKKVNTLKAQRGVSDENVTALRQRATEVALQDEFTNDLGAKTTVQNVFIGSPQLFLSINEEGQVQINTRPFTQTATEKVVTKGYIENGELTLSEDVSGTVNTVYVSKMSKADNNKNVKIPIVVVKRGVNYVALPIKMTQFPLDSSVITEEMEMVNSAPNVTELAKAINAVIIKYNLPIQKTIPNTVSEEDINRIEKALREYRTSVPAESIAEKDYNKSNLQADAEMYIDIDNLNEVIKDAKIRIDLPNITFSTSYDINSMSKEDVEKEIDNVIESMRTKMHSATVAQTEQLESFFEPFNDELEVVGSEITTQTKFEVLKKMFDKQLKPAEKNFFGNEIVSKAKALTTAYENILKQATPDSNLKNSGKNNTKCKK